MATMRINDTILGIGLRTTTIRVDLQKPRFFLCPLGNIHFGGVIFDPEFLEGDANLMAIGRAERIPRPSSAAIQ